MYCIINCVLTKGKNSESHYQIVGVERSLVSACNQELINRSRGVGGWDLLMRF